jgi:hypothetical protein
MTEGQPPDTHAGEQEADLMHQPWTQALWLFWRPRLTFYERRIEFLRVLDERKELVSFSVEETNITAEVDRGLSLTLEEGSLHLRVGAGDRRALIEPAKLALDMVAPDRFRQMILTTQHVFPVDADYTAARQIAIATTLGQAARSHPLSDFALLLDGVPRSFAGEFHAEFGVVSATELPARLARRIGRMSVHAPTEADDQWADRPLPDVALFTDSAWVARPDPTPDRIDWIDFWETALEDANMFADELWSPVDARLRESSLSERTSATE